MRDLQFLYNLSKPPGMLRCGLQALDLQGRTQSHRVTPVPREDSQKDSKHLLVVTGGAFLSLGPQKCPAFTNTANTQAPHPKSVSGLDFPL